MTKLLAHARQHSVGYVALFVSLAGTSYAAVKIPTGSVGNPQLKNHAITPIKLDPNTIAGYMRDWVQINAQGQIVASRPAARLITWETTGAGPGGLIGWSQPIPAACFALATTTTQGGVLSYASAQLASAGAKNDAGTYVLLSAPARAVNVAIMCPQP
ncbi:MAG: hypothetical protein ABSH51_30315 [Solirubrobacteraceae bacterium]|jgi:hypothetical protein